MRHGKLHRRRLAGAALAFAAILLPTAAITFAVSGARVAGAAVAACAAAKSRIWMGIPGSGEAATSPFERELITIGTKTCTMDGYPEPGRSVRRRPGWSPQRIAPAS